MENRVEEYMAGLKTEWRSSPIDWHSFHQFLKNKQTPNGTPPPVPMILAASAESAASKHRRLGEQLMWAAQNGCLSEAIEELDRIPKENWENSSEEKWNRDWSPTI